MSMLDYNHALFVSEFENMIESQGFYFTKPFTESSKGERFYESVNGKRKAVGRYKYIFEGDSGYPLIMWTIFAITDKNGKETSASQTSYFWYKPPNEGNSSDHGERVKEAKKRSDDYKKQRAERERKAQQLQIELRKQAQSEYFDVRSFNDVNNHPYLLKKKVQAAKGVALAIKDLTVDSHYNKELNDENKTYTYIKRGDLIIPAMNVDREFMTYQIIRSDGSKRQRIDVSTKEAFFIFGTLDENTVRVYLCEGYATGASLFRATQLTVLVCFDVDNVLNVAKAIIAKYKGKVKISFCTDNDRKKKTRVGLFKGFDYAYQTGFPFLFPKFDETKENENRSDWNDLAEIMSDQDMLALIHRQEEYFNIVGKWEAIKMACTAYGVELDDLKNYAELNKTRSGDIFSELFV
ncbi:hypothetical protein [Acinetobacter sp. P1(2025)]|uniref:hypothetical protein n=1 Tax=Acinetobacter sp. P1(2025) TaxID=3446120 RepID=UPI003F52B800